MIKVLTALAVLAVCVLTLFVIGTGKAKDSWRLGVQAWTFNRFTFHEAVDKAAALDIHFIEAFPGQALIPGEPDARLHHSMSAEHRRQVGKKLEEAGVDLVSYGVVDLPAEEQQAREIFEFAKEMGIETIVAEPAPEALDLAARLCEEYGVKVAIHNHPKPSRYWNPQTVLDAVSGRTRLMGACADTGHWMRSGIRPVDALKALEGRIITLHLKDLNEFGVADAHDVPWGTGEADLAAVFQELDRQGFEGVFSIEYEYNWDDSMSDIAKCVAWFRDAVASMK